MRNPPAKWTLPETINPPERLCITVQVPNDPFHVAAFWGAMLSLSSAYKWADDPEHKAREVALVWREIIDDMVNAGWDNCTMPFDVRQNEENPCTLEKTENGVDWDAFANLRLCAPELRINNGKIQWRNPVTGIWIDTPDQGDERDNGTYDPPYPPGSVPPGQSAECLSAENILSVYSSIFTQIRADLLVGKFATSIAAGVTGILSAFMPVAIIGTIALSLSAGAIALGESGVNDMISTESLELIRCNLYCHAESDGSFTASGYNAFYEQLSIDFSGAKLILLQYYFDMLGSVGLSRQGKANGIESADCSDCGCVVCCELDFTVSSVHSAKITDAPYNDTTWVSGIGWRSGVSGGNTYLGVKIPFTTNTKVARVVIEYAMNQSDPFSNEYFYVFTGGTLHSNYLLPGGDGIHEYTIDLNIDNVSELQLVIDTASSTTPNDFSKIVIYSYDIQPFDDCAC